MKPPGKPATPVCGTLEKADAPYRALSRQRVMVALEAYRQLALPGSPGPAALGRVADVRMETASRVLAELKAAGA